MSELVIPDKLRELRSDPESLRIIRIFAEIGLDLETISPDIVLRLKLLNAKTKFLEDEHQATHYARAVFDWYERNRQEQSWSDMEKRIVTVGTMFSDIGKTGPKSANIEQQKLIVEMYGIENVENPTMPVANFIKEYFQDADERLSTFKSLGLDPEMSMRSFWDLHVFWTLEIIGGDGVPPEAVIAAAVHHFVQGLNPQGMVGDDGRFKSEFGANRSFSRVEKLIILLDQYDAFRRRGRMNNERAIIAVRGYVGRSGKFANDAEFAELIDVIGFTNREIQV